jgi:hypothetical protein
MIVRSVADDAAAVGSPLTLAVVTGPWRPASLPRSSADGAISIGLTPGLHVVALPVAGPRGLLGLRAERAALLASSEGGMQRIGIAWGVGASAELLIECACTSLAVAALSPDGVGPLLGGPPPPR